MLIETISSVFAKDDDRSPVKNDQSESDVEQDNWEVVVGSNSYKQNIDYQNSFKEMVKQVKSNIIYHKHSKKDNAVYVYVNSGKLQMEQSQFVYTEPDRITHYIVSKGVHAAMTICKVGGYNYKLTASHVTHILSFDELASCHTINPAVVIVSNKPVKRATFKWVVKTGDRIDWYTKELESDRYVFMNTHISYVVTNYVPEVRGTRIMPIAIVTTVSLEEPLVMSGTAMFVGKKPFIVIASIKHPNNVYTIMAAAPIPHSVDIKLTTTDEADSH